MEKQRAGELRELNQRLHKMLVKANATIVMIGSTAGNVDFFVIGDEQKVTWDIQNRGVETIVSDTNANGRG